MTVRPLVPTERQRAVGDIGSVVDGERDPGVAEPASTPRLPAAPPARGRAWVRTLRDADPRRIPGPKTPLVVFGLIAVIGQWDDAALFTLLPDIRAELGLSTQVLATISSAVSLMALALAVPAGQLADRYRRVVLLRASFIGTNVASIVQATAPGLGQVVGGRFLAGTGIAFQEAASFSFVADTYPRSTRTRVFGFMTLIGLFGAVLGPLVAGTLGQALGWRAALGALGVLATAVALLSFLLREPARGAVDRAEAGADAPGAERAFVEPPPLPLAEAMRAAWSIRTVRRLVLATPFLYLKGAAGLGLLSLYYADVLVLTPGQIGAVAAGGAALTMVGVVVAAPLGDRLLAERPGAFLPLAAAGTAVQAAALLALGATTTPAIAIAVSLPVTTLDLILLPAFYSLLSQVVPARVRGVGLQILKPAQLVGIVLFPILAGIVDRVGFQRGIALFAVPTLIGAAIIAGGGPGTVRDRRTAIAAELAQADAGTDGTSSVLLARDVVAGYDGRPVVDGVDLDVVAGEVLAVVGPNGAGKTTLLRSLAGVVPVMSGAVVLGGSDVTTTTAATRARSGVAFVPGGSAVIAGLTVVEHLRAAAALAAGADDARARADAVLESEPALRARRDQDAGTLSGGEQQLLALACAHASRPRVLLLDELSLGLAPAAVREALAAARQAADAGAAVVVVEQAVEAVLDIADRAAVVDKGRIVWSGPAADLRSQPAAVAGIALGTGRPPSRRHRDRPRHVDRGAAEAVLRATSVSAAFGGVQALDGVDVHVGAAEVVGLIGPNGAGKTTLFDVVSGFVTPDDGRVELGGADVTAASPHERARLGLRRTFQRARLFPGMSVRDAVLTALDRQAPAGTALSPLGLPAPSRAEGRLRRRADATLELLDLHHWAGVAVGDLPTGTRRLVAIACTLAFSPSVLLLDEPTAGLTRGEAEDIPPLLRRTARETGAGLLVIEHDVPLLTDAAHRLVAMVGGRVVAEGDADTVVTHPTVMAAYLGRPETAPAHPRPATPEH